MPNVIETTDAAANSTTAYVLGLGQTAQGQLATGADHDWFAVSLTAGQTYTFAMTGTGVGNVVDPYLRLYGTNGATLVAQNDDGLQGNNSAIAFTPGTSGVYYLDAGSYNNSHAGQYGLSFTFGTKAAFDTQMGAGVIDTDFSWSATPGTGATVTYGFRQNPAAYTVPGSDISSFSQLTAAQIAAVQAILQFYSELAGITFVPVNPGGYTNNATILFANYFDPNDGAGAFAFYPGSTASTAPEGDVWLNTAAVSTTSLPFGGYSFFAIMHEVGHALGLSHPGLYNAAPGVSITYANDAQFVQDTQQYSVMSYFDESNTGAGNYNSFADTPMLLDVHALQNIYGANTATRNGNTIYGFGSTAGAAYDFALNASPAFCIWDGGGIDTLDCSGFIQDQILNLAEGSFSSVGGIAMNVATALGAVIENAAGGSGNDTILGNAVANVFVGGIGNDSLDGVGGADIIYGGLGNDTLHGGLGNDKLKGNEDNDTIFGDAGDDIIEGHGGTNVLNGGAGNDLLYVEGVNDRAVEAVGEGFDAVYAFSDFALEAGSEVEWLIARLTTGMTISGNELANRLNGEIGGDTLSGNGGNDQLYGGGGIDTLSGGGGNDFIYGDAGGDTLRPGLGFDQLIGGAGNDSFRFEVADFESSAGTGFYDNIYDYSRDAGAANLDTIRLQGAAADYQFQTTSSPSWLRITHAATGGTIYVTTVVTANPAVLAGQVEYFV